MICPYNTSRDSVCKDWNYPYKCLNCLRTIAYNSIYWGVVRKMMKLKITCFIVLFLMVSVNLLNTDNLSVAESLEDEETSKEVIVPLSSANIPGFQEGSIYTDSTITSSGQHVCVILDNGSVSCWGYSGEGQLGNGGTSDKTIPTLTSSLGTGRTAVAISSGGGHTCVILDNGAVSCWGYGTKGQLGNGGTSNLLTPILTSSLGVGRTAVAISAGSAYTCAILDDGTVSCWGRNSEGQLGDGTYNQRNTPTQTSSLGTGRTAVAISSGYDHTCAILDNDSISCWGRNSEGQLGDGTNIQRNTPTQTSSLGTGRTAVAISSGGGHTCAILDDGSVSCWGYNLYGGLGDGTNTDRSTPTQTSNLGTGRTAVAISSGGGDTCVILDNGAVSCWGNGDYGKLGNGDTTHKNTPTLTSTFGTGRTAVALSLSSMHTCAIIDDGSVSCWGYGASGLIGNGADPRHKTTPTLTSSLGTGRTAAVSERDFDHNGIHNIFETIPPSKISCNMGQYGIYVCVDAPTGKYVPTNSATYATDADIGYYVNQTGQTIQTACPEGTTTPNTGASSIDDCAVGIDSDGDGVYDNFDTFPNDASETVDSDGDGTGNNADAFPNDPNETTDSDGDGVGNNTDVFPNDPNETTDSDGDGVGNNADALPNDASETVDSDGDGVGDNSDEFQNDPSETVDSDGDGVGDNSDVYPNDPTKSENETASNESENDNNSANNTEPTNLTNGTEPTNSTNGTEPTNSTNVIEYIDYECATQDFDCDGSPNDGDNDADADGIMDLADSNELVTDVKWLHKFTIFKTSDGFEVQIEYRVPYHNAYGSHVSWVMSVDENGNERDMPLMWDIAMDGSSYKMGVSTTHMDELKQNLCRNPHGSPMYSDFDMYEWLNNSVLIEEVHVVPTEIGCSWKNQPKEVDLNKLTADIQSEDFLFRMHKEYEVLKYTIKYDVSENSQNLTILPIWAVNDTIGTSSSNKAFYVDDQVNGTTSVWFWWSQSYSSAFDLENAEIGAMNSSSSGLMSNIGFVVAALLGILIIRRRRRKKKLKRAIKKIAKEHILDEKIAKKQAKLEKKKIKAESKAITTDLTDTNSANIEYYLGENTKPIIALPSQEIQESEPEKPFKPPENTSQLSPVGPINFDTDGYEWSTDRFERPIYRVAGSSDHWSLWES